MRVGPIPRSASSPTAGPRRSAVLAVAATAALGLAACGGDDGDDEATVAPDAAPATTAAAAPAADTEEGKAAAVVSAYLAAFSKGDGQAVCKLYTPTQRRSVAKAIDGSCADGIRAAFQQGGAEDGFSKSLGKVRVGDTTIDGSSATVKLAALQGGQSADGLTVRLQKSGGRWLISKPSGG